MYMLVEGNVCEHVCACECAQIHMCKHTHTYTHACTFSKFLILPSFKFDYTNYLVLIKMTIVLVLEFVFESDQGSLIYIFHGKIGS